MWISFNYLVFLLNVEWFSRQNVTNFPIISHTPPVQISRGESLFKIGLIEHLAKFAPNQSCGTQYSSTSSPYELLSELKIWSCNCCAETRAAHNKSGGLKSKLLLHKTFFWLLVIAMFYPIWPGCQIQIQVQIQNTNTYSIACKQLITNWVDLKISCCSCTNFFLPFVIAITSYGLVLK